tara:strand:- start:375 stop:569 length:195 start_codon:yes stop_codon:yes gene_type:complete
MFTHPKKVCMTYFQHFKLSLNFCYLFAKGFFKSLIHAVLPDIFITSTTDINNEIKKLLDESGCR